jgi:putative chitinase
MAMSLTPEKISSALRADLRSVGAIWPLVLVALDEFGIRSDLVEIAAAATIMTETRTFSPRREIHADPTRQPDLWKAQERYWPSGYYGRGLIQTTWAKNYKALGDALGLDLLANPDLLLDPKIAAKGLAFFFKTNGVHKLADVQDWLGVRTRINGVNHSTGLPNGWKEFQTGVLALLAVAHG